MIDGLSDVLREGDRVPTCGTTKVADCERIGWPRYRPVGGRVVAEVRVDHGQ